MKSVFGWREWAREFLSPPLPNLVPAGQRGGFKFLSSPLSHSGPGSVPAASLYPSLPTLLAMPALSSLEPAH